MTKPDCTVPSVVDPNVKLVWPVNVPLPSSVPFASVALLIVVLMVMSWLRMKPGSCATVTVPMPGIVVVLFPLRFHCVDSAVSAGDR